MATVLQVRKLRLRLQLKKIRRRLQGFPCHHLRLLHFLSLSLLLNLEVLFILLRVFLILHFILLPVFPIRLCIFHNPITISLTLLRHILRQRQAIMPHHIIMPRYILRLLSFIPVVHQSRMPTLALGTLRLGSNHRHMGLSVDMAFRNQKICLQGARLLQTSTERFERALVHDKLATETNLTTSQMVSSILVDYCTFDHRSHVFFRPDACLDVSVPRNTGVIGGAVSWITLRLPGNTPFDDFFARVCANMDLDPATAQLGYKFHTDRVRDPPHRLSNKQELRQAMTYGLGLIRRARSRRIVMQIQNLVRLLPSHFILSNALYYHLLNSILTPASCPATCYTSGLRLG